MLLDLIFNGIYVILEFIVNLIPNLDSIQIPSGINSALSYISNLAGYFLPMSDFAMIFGIWIFVTNFRFIYNLFAKIWDMLPLT